jgi:D-alanyl-D-alanine carboxypeptidase
MSRRPNDQSTTTPADGGFTWTRRVVLGSVLGIVAVIVLIAASVAGGGQGRSAGSPGPEASLVAQATGEPTSPVASASPVGSPTPGTPGSPSPEPTTAADGSGASPTPLESQGPSSIPAGRLEAKLRSMATRASLPGVFVAIVWDDGRTWVGTAGLADVASNRPVTPDSGFALASISKTFTAAVVLQLVDEGRLKLDQPVAPLLPDFGLDDRISLRMLLDHTSGLADFFFNPRIDALLQSEPDATWSAQRSWAMVPKRLAKPGKRWAYSNTNYLLLGEVVEAVTGHSLADEVRTRLLDPLGLHDTWYQVAERPITDPTTGYRLITTKKGKVKPRAVAPASDVMPFRSVVTAAGGAGSIAATALDTARWMQAFAGGRVLSPATQQAMLADVARTEARHARIPYGLGIQEVTILGRTALGHSGRYLGFRNVVRYLPDEGVTVAVLTNQGGYDPARIARALLKIVLPSPSPATPSPSPSAVASPVASAASG